MDKVITSIPAVASLTNKQPLSGFEQSEQARKLALVRTISRWLIGLVAILIPVELVLIIFRQQYWLALLIGTLIVSIGLWVVSLTIAQRGNVELASQFLLGGVLLVVLAASFLQGATSYNGLGFAVAIGLAVTLLGIRQVILTTVLGAVVIVGLTVLERLFAIYSPPGKLVGNEQVLLDTMLISLIYIALAVVLVVPFRSQIKTIREQYNQLETALAELTERQQNSQVVSEQVLDLAVTLSATANQQAGGSQEQVAVVSQINSAMSELSSTVASIDDLALQITMVAGEVNGDISRIEETTYAAVSKSNEGQAAVKQTLRSSEQAEVNYQELLNGTTYLQSRSERVRSTLSIIASIAEETHLLALNAAIEAAGAGEYGQRFGIVAQEIKALAARAANASRDVVERVTEFDQALANSTQILRRGAEQSEQMLQTNRNTEAVFGNINGLVGDCRQQALTIREAAFQMREQIEVIRSATNQHRSATQQILSALQGLATVAQQSAHSSKLVAHTATDLEKLSTSLTTTLAA